MMDIRPTSEAAEAYIWFGRDCLRRAQRTGHGGVKALRDGLLLVICKYTIHHADLIVIQQGDFTMHPRSGSLRAYPVADDTTIPGVNGGGYVKAGTQFAELSARQPYPLVYDDHGTFIISIDGEDLEVEWADAGSENYGNLWWSGTGDDPQVLSWKGPPSVQFGIPTTADISGLTQPDHAGISTPFSCYIYQGGARIHGPQPLHDSELATLVVGACYARDDSGRDWLVAVCVTAQGSKYFLQVWRSKGSGEEWELVADFPSVRASSPAFISSDGRSFVYAGTRYEIDAGVSSVRSGASTPTAQDGTRTVTGTGGYGSSYEFAEGAGHCWPSISSNGELVFSTYTESASFTGTGNGDTQNQVVQVPVYRGNPATEVIVRPGYDNGFVFDAEPNGKYCSVQWSGVDRYKGTRAWKAAPKGCNTDFSVSVTLLPQGVVGTYTHNSEQSDMTISGPTTAYVGAQYSTSHAIAPVTWSISSGSISETGLVTEIGCGGYTVTATDFCGRTASISATLSSSLTISGTETPSVGSQYAVSGARGDVVWSISAGSINTVGMITSVGCGTGTITATDSCGRTGAKEVRFPSGYWSEISHETYQSGETSYVYTKTIGGTQYIERVEQGVNVEDYTCKVWNSIQHICVDYTNGCQRDAGYKSSWEAPVTISPVVSHYVSADEGCGSRYDYYTYWHVLSRQILRWVCP